MRIKETQNQVDYQIFFIVVNIYFSHQNNTNYLYPPWNTAPIFPYKPNPNRPSNPILNPKSIVNENEDEQKKITLLLTVIGLIPFLFFTFFVVFYFIPIQPILLVFLSKKKIVYNRRNRKTTLVNKCLNVKYNQFVFFFL